MQNALFRSFDTVIKAQLDPHWHRIGPKTRQLVNDLSTLRQLLTYLLSFDAVSFNQFLETILASNTTNLTTGRPVVNQSPWLFLPAADIIFETARNRVYKKVAVQPGLRAKSSSANETNGAEPRAAAVTITSHENRAESEDQYWDQNDNSLFTDEAVLAASQSAPSAPSSPLTSSSSALHPKSGDHDGSHPTGLSAKAKGKRPLLHQPEITYIPDDISMGEDTNGSTEKQSWAYWCPSGTVPVLEEQPKWFLLREILEEVEAQIHWSPASYGKFLPIRQMQLNGKLK